MADGMFILVISVMVFHLIITLMFAIRIRMWKPHNSNSRPSISIIIAARNEYKNLKQLIPALLQLDYQNVEICIGLDRCDDESKAFLDQEKSPLIRYINIESTPEDWNPKKFALNEAINVAKGEWLVFTDADCLPRSDQWLNELTKEMTENINCVIGLSPYVLNQTLLGQYVRFEAYMTAFVYAAMTLFSKPYMAVGRNMAIRKSYFEAIGGYSEIKSITGGDDDLLFQGAIPAHKVAIALGEKSLVDTTPENSWGAYFKQKLRHFSVSKHYKTQNQLLLTIYHAVHFLSYLLLFMVIEQVYLIPILLFYLFIKLVGYRFAASKMGFGFNYILVPCVDILYAFFTPVLSIWSKLVKDIKWKN